MAEEQEKYPEGEYVRVGDVMEWRWKGQAAPEQHVVTEPKAPAKPEALKTASKPKPPARKLAARKSATSKAKK